MLSSSILNKIDQIWTCFSKGGITTPIIILEQITYLMFIRSLDEKDIESERLDRLTYTTTPKIFPLTPKGQSMRWSQFKHKDPREMYDIINLNIFPFLETMRLSEHNNVNTAFLNYMEDASFAFPKSKIQLLEKAITGLDTLFTESITDQETLGHLYEYMLGKLSTSAENGQFSTPKHIRDLMVALMSPTPEEQICDPACRTAGFLVSSAEYIRKHYESSMTATQWEHFRGSAFTGFDSDSTILRLSAMNLLLHSIENPQIKYCDSISNQNNISSKFNLILANPTFSGTIDEENIHDSLKEVTDTNRSEILFLALFLRMLKVGGRCACIVPPGVLSPTHKSALGIRKELVEKHHLQGIISLPSTVFLPYSIVSASILIFSKTGVGGTGKVWFYEMYSDGFSQDNKRKPIESNDIPDIIQRFQNLDGELNNPPTAQSFFVSKAEMVKKNYDFSIKAYKNYTYEKVKYQNSMVILERLQQLNQEMSHKEEALKELLLQSKEHS